MTSTRPRGSASARRAEEQADTLTRGRRQRLGAGLVIGLLSAGVALGVGELVAAFVRPAAAPVVAVGNRLIVLTPEPVKRWAIREFGTNDKHVLLTGIFVVIALLALAVGTLAVRRRLFGLAGIGVFGLVGGYCALTANASRAGDVVPILVGTAAALAVMTVLTRTVGTDEAHGVLDRRRFLQAGGAAGALAVVAGFGGRAASHSRFNAAAARAAVTLPPAVDPGTATIGTMDLGKSGIPFQTPNKDFYRIDTAISVPQINPKTWTLKIHGMVDREVSLSYDQLIARPLVERWITMACVSNEVGGTLISNAKFTGVLLADILREAGVDPKADQLLTTSADGMTIGAPTGVVMDGRDALLAVAMNGEALPVEHGFPVRMVVPGLYGYVSGCKWIVDIKATTFDDDRAYWVQGGWAPRGPVLLSSRIDTPRDGTVLSAGTTVPIAGVAWDQHVGVSAVQVKVDDGDWQDARLAAVPSTDTWRQWVLPWTVPSSGRYQLSVRAVDETGTVQESVQHEPYPSGATGYHTITVRSR